MIEKSREIQLVNNASAGLESLSFPYHLKTVMTKVSRGTVTV
jgi:hypothetical protein